jgi:hypothetical protein
MRATSAASLPLGRPERRAVILAYAIHALYELTRVVARRRRHVAAVVLRVELAAPAR